MNNNAPNIVAGQYVVEYAQVDDSIEFTQRYTLNVGGQWLAKVPNIAITQEFDSTDFALQFCAEDWQALGISSGHQTIDQAKQYAERCYRGITSNWVKNHTDLATARAEFEAELQAEACSFCHRNFYQVQSMIGSDVRICNICITEFYLKIQVPMDQGH